MSNSRPGQYLFGQFRIDLTERLLARNDIDLPLPPKCFDLLTLLVQNAGRLLEKERIIQALWPKTFVEEANVPNLIAQLRKTLGDSPDRSHYIQTVPKRGYRFVAAVKTVEDKPRESRPAAETSRRTGIRLIAFPFRNDPGGDSGHLAYSLPDAIAATLAELNAFTVRSTQLAMRFDPLRWDPQSVAAEADVDVILAGTLARAGERIHATTQLIDAPSATVIWSKVWDIPARDLFRLQSGVVQLIVRTLLRRTREHHAAALAGMDTPAAPDAYELYLRANQLALKRSPENMSLARDLYLACTQIDPNYAPAWARLGRCYRWLEKFSVSGAASAGSSAEAAFQKAFQLNPYLAIAHSGYTPIQCDSGHAHEAMIRLLGTLPQSENNPEIFAALVHACRYCGQLDASLAAHQRAFQLDRNFHTSVAHTHFALGDYEKVLYWYDSKAGLYLDALALASMGRLEEASALLWTRRERFSMQPALMNSLQCYLDGDAAGGLAALRNELTCHPRDPEVSFYMARQASRLGDLDLARQLLSQSVESGYSSSSTLTKDAWLEPLRATPDFQRMLSSVQTCECVARRAFADAGGERIFRFGPRLVPQTRFPSR